MTQDSKSLQITDDQIQKFNLGINYHSYFLMGAHILVEEACQGVRFCVWAPNAVMVSVVGDFNQWDSNKNPMKRIDNSGLWELFISGMKEFQLYKYAVQTVSGELLFKYDPYSFYSELRPRTASVIYDLEGYPWRDQEWQKKKTDTAPYHKPMLIYEVHLGSWKRKEDQSFLTYRELADELVDYVIQMGYTHIELLPIAEHPFDGSWGYQVVGYYAATSRYGTPKDFMYFVDRCHQKGIGVILDWVPGHFPKDAHGLAHFDGTALYEHEDRRQGEHPQWGTMIFNYGRYEVQDFLISNLLFWLEYYHVDGFRVDAVASMLYLDFAREEWIPNRYGGRENLEAVDFMRKMNEAVFKEFPNTLMVAEESSAWPMVTKPTNIGGLGFNYKWNMGWMNDVLRYVSMDPIYRKWNHNLITFSMVYAYSENYILPLSHDEVVHGKRSLLDKMPGDYYQKFSGLRSLYGFMMAHPGKKLLFMGGEFGQFVEWKYDTSLDWLLLGYEMHRKMQDYVKELNNFYINTPCLWEEDHNSGGFQWIVGDDSDQSAISFLRRGKMEDDILIIIVNFTPVKRSNYRIGVPKAFKYTQVFNSDDERFGGSGMICNGSITVDLVPSHGFSYSVTLTLPPLSVVYIKPID